jgi:hypothetical protein
MLVLNGVYPFKLSFCSPIHCPHGVRPLSWIQRERCWQLSAIRHTLIPNYLPTWRGSLSREGLLGRCGFLVGVCAWWRCQAGIGCGDWSLTVAILFVHIKSGLEVVVVDNCKA